MQFLHTDVGHQNVIVSIAFSPDGSRILSGSWDGTAKIWDVASGAHLDTLAWGSKDVEAVAWSPDGKLVAVAGSPPAQVLSAEQLASYQAYFDHRDRSIFELPQNADEPTAETRLFDPRDGTLLRIIKDSGEGVAFAPDGRTMAVVSWGSLSIHDLSDGSCLSRFDDEQTDLRNVYYSVDGKRLACVCSDCVRVFDAFTAKPLFNVSDTHLFYPSEEAIARLTLHRLPDALDHVEPEAEPAFAARFWQLMLAGFQPHSLSDQGMEYQRIAFSPLGNRLAFLVGHDVTHLIPSGGILLDAATLEIERIFGSPTLQWLRTLAFSPDGRLLAAAGDDQTVIVWELANGEEKCRIGNPPTAINAIAFSPSRPYLAAGTKDGTVILCDALRHEVLAVDEIWTTPIAQVEFSPSRDSLLIASQDGKIRIVELPGLATICEFRAHRGRFLGGTYSADGTHFVSVGDADEPPCPNGRGANGEIIRWTLSSGVAQESQLLLENFRVGSVSASRDRSKLAISLWRELIIVDIGVAITVMPLVETHKMGIQKVAFAGDSERLLLANDGYGMKLVDLQGEKLGDAFVATRDGPTSFAFSSSGKMMARSTAYSNEIELFEVPTGELKKQFLGHQNSVRSLAISPDDRLLASGSNDGTLKIWDFESGNLTASIVLRPRSPGMPRQSQCLRYGQWPRCGGWR